MGSVEVPVLQTVALPDRGEGLRGVEALAPGREVRTEYSS